MTTVTTTTTTSRTATDAKEPSLPTPSNTTTNNNGKHPPLHQQPNLTNITRSSTSKPSGGDDDVPPSTNTTTTTPKTNPQIPSSSSSSRRRHISSKKKHHATGNVVGKPSGSVVVPQASEPYRLIPLADIHDDASQFEFNSLKRVQMVGPCFLLPHNEYETVLRRRGWEKEKERQREMKQQQQQQQKYANHVTNSVVKKKEGSNNNNNTSRRALFQHMKMEKVMEDERRDEERDVVQRREEKKGEEEDEVGVDGSLGMKLTIMEGRVIVQGLNSLSDGRASPAQLTGMIHTGDVLVMINSFSLRGLTIDQLITTLQTLSNPAKKELYLRFAIGEGVALLQQQTNEEGMKMRSTSSMKAEEDLFSLSQFLPRDFAFVDQLSGLPLFGDDGATTKNKAERKAPLLREGAVAAGALGDAQRNVIGNKPLAVTAAKEIARMEYSTPDIVQFIASGLVATAYRDKKKWRSEYFELNETLPELLRDVNSDRERKLQVRSSSEMMSFSQARSEQKKLGEKAIAGAAAVYHYVRNMDEKREVIPLSTRVNSMNRSMRGGRRADAISEKDEEEEELYSSSEEEDDLILLSDGFDRVWKERIVHLLKESIQEKETDDAQESKTNQVERDADETNEFESLLFGSDTAARMLTSKSKSLPDTEMTSHLFEFAVTMAEGDDGRSVASSKMGFSMASSRMGRSITSTRMRMRLIREDATLFLLMDALPLWMETFKPLALEHRKMLFPLHHLDYPTGDGDMSEGTRSSWGLSQTRPWGDELMEAKLDPETRVQTCYLVTFYFSKKFLDKVNHQMTEKEEKEACNFILKYGAYLRLHTSLVAASNSHSQKVTDALLDVARYDLKHKEMMKELSKIGRIDAVILYEPPMLSAILFYLQKSLLDYVHYQAFLPILTTAYPDLKPWQVKDRISSDHYYEFLTLLLHPTEGSGMAKRDKKLVQEWCTLSASRIDLQDRLNNFHAVALIRNNGVAKLYYRDLPMLLNLSMKVQDDDLSLDLVDEIIFHRKYGKDNVTLSSVVDHLRLIAKTVIHQRNEPLDTSPILQRVIFSFNSLTHSKSTFARESFHVPDQLLHLLYACIENEADEETVTTTITKKQAEFIKLIAKSARPVDAIMTLVKWEAICPSSMVVVAPALQSLLRRGALEGFRDELSGSLLRLQWARNEKEKNGGNVENDGHGKDGSGDYSWIHERIDSGDISETKVDSFEDDDVAVRERGSWTSSEVAANVMSGGEIWQKLLDGKASIEK